MDSRNILKLELRGYVSGMDVRYKRERRVKNYSKIFGLFNRKKSRFYRGKHEFRFGESDF